MSKPQNVNAFDDSVSDLQETYDLFTLDSHSVRSVSAQKGKTFFAAINFHLQKIIMLGKLCN